MPQIPQSDYEFSFHLKHSGGWIIRGSPLDLHDHQVLAMATAHRHLVEVEAEYDGYAANSGSAGFFRSAALIVSHHHAVKLASDALLL